MNPAEPEDEGREEMDDAEKIAALTAELTWISLFADMRSRDESKVFARVNRGALRTIAERARQATGSTQRAPGDLTPCPT